MRGGVQLTVAILWSIILFKQANGISRCDRTPEGNNGPKSPADGRFKLKISGSPNTYVSGVIYTISLQGTRQLQVAQKFTGFLLSVEPSEFRDSSLAYRSVGSFQLFGDALTKFSEKCPNTVTQTSSLPKSEIQVLWTAPPPGSGCVVFRATVVEQRDVWYMDDGPLSRTLCEDVQENLDEQPQVIEKCCACDEAKYEVTFEGLWSRHTHPKDFPSNGWLTRFSDVIGASHTSDYRFWEYGGVASEGLKQVAERGATRMLESELKAESEHIRTIIKARGISYPNVTGKTFAVFRVDRKHHLMSLVSMIDPSPDWIVGVSGLELCLRNCSWVEFKVLNLYPWDAGTDSGTTYISPDSPTNPRDVIRRITSSFPNDPSSPFYDPTGIEMKPLARLYLTRQRLYEKSCADDSISPDEEDSSQQNDCAVGEWTEWSSCSVTCGKGTRLRQRFYLNQMRADMMLCQRQLTSRISCIGKQRVCRENPYGYHENTDVNDALLEDPLCQVTEWSEWTPCSTTCGVGVRTRNRKYTTRAGRKKCMLIPRAPILQQTVECEQEDCDEEEMLEEVDDGENCDVSQWSDWSPCSVTCGMGQKMRTRQINKLKDKVTIALGQDYINTEPRDSCRHVKLTQEVQCEGDYSSCDVVQYRSKDVCSQPKDSGKCRLHMERWYFDVTTESCQPFFYYGCQGNENNFVTKADCEKTCLSLKETSQSNEESQSGPFGGLEPGSQIIDKDISFGLPASAFTPMTIDSITSNDGDVIDCVVTRWSEWSPCSATCGRGFKQRSRSIQVNPQNGGKQCPKKLLKRKKCKIQNCDEYDSYSPRDSQEYPTWGEATYVKYDGNGRDCVLSNWTPWSQCSASCGLNAVMQRTRNIIVEPSENGKPCDYRIQTKDCSHLLPCKF